MLSTSWALFLVEQGGKVLQDQGLGVDGKQLATYLMMT